MFKPTKSPSPSPAEESHPRNPRVHRQSGISSINRPRGLSGSGVSNETNIPRTSRSFATKHGHQHLSREPMPQTSTPATSHRRVASMPRSLPSVTQTQIDIDGDRVARGLVSPPIVDFTRFDDGYRGPRNGNFEGLVTKMKQTSRRVSIKPILKRSPHSSGASRNDPTNIVSNPHPASMRKPDPRLIVSALESIVPDSPKKPADVLDVYELLGMHQLDQLDFEERHIARSNNSQTRPRGEMVVLGEPLRKVSIYASTTMVLGGREHDLPIIVVSCVEELYRTGIYQPNLFRTLPNRSRLLELINIFDSEQQPPGSIIRSRQSSPTKNPSKSGFGANTSLHLESTPDICALLSTYLSALPEPMLLPALFRPIWEWCGLEEDEVDELQLKPFQRRISSVPLSRTYTNPTESMRISVAQLVLHLLPSPHFSLLVYILAFFSQVAMVHEENGVGIEDLARMFGSRIFGGGQSKRRKLSTEIAMTDPHETRMEGEIMMCWFLRRWGLISEGLFAVIEDVKMGVLPGDGQVPNHSSGRDTPFKSSSGDDASRSSDNSRPRSKSFLKFRSNSKTSNNNGSEALEGDSNQSLDCAVPVAGKPLNNETFNISTVTNNMDIESVYSAAALDERLLDVSMPTLLNQTIGPFNDDDDDDDNKNSRSVLPMSVVAKTGDDIDKARQHILVLEDELKKLNKVITESLQELSKEKLKRSNLERRVEELELALKLERDENKAHGSGLDAVEYGKMLEIVEKERDDALDLVREIRKLMVKN